MAVLVVAYPVAVIPCRGRAVPMLARGGELHSLRTAWNGAPQHPDIGINTLPVDIVAVKAADITVTMCQVPGMAVGGNAVSQCKKTCKIGKIAIVDVKGKALAVRGGGRPGEIEVWLPVVMAARTPDVIA